MSHTDEKEKLENQNAELLRLNAVLKTELVESQARTTAAEKGAGIGVWDWYPPAKNVYYSPQWKSMLGYADHEIANTTDQWTALMHPEDVEPTWNTVRRILDGTSHHYENEFRLRHKDGGYRWVLSRSLITRDDKGCAVRMVGAHIDITEKKRIEKSLSDSLLLIDTLLEASPAGIAFFDNQLHYAKLNRAFAEELGGTSREAHLGKAVSEISPSFAVQVRCAFEQIVETGEPIINQEFGGNAETSGAARTWLASFYPLYGRAHELLGMGSVVLNISERKRSQLALAVLAEELKRSNRELEQFASVASHDLKEPLRAVESYLGLLTKKYQGQLGPEADKFIFYARDGARRMYKLVDALRRYARAGTTPMEVKAVEMDDILTAALANLHAAILESKATIVRDPLPVLWVDAIQLEQVFQNLISNGIKFCKGPHPPRIEIRATLQTNGWQFSVSDNGIGMSEGNTERIFEIFRRLPSVETYPGDGIGLAVTKKIIERHRGKIWVESTLGNGSTFHFTLPNPEAINSAG